MYCNANNGAGGSDRKRNSRRSLVRILLLWIAIATASGLQILVVTPFLHDSSYNNKSIRRTRTSPSLPRAATVTTMAASSNNGDNSDGSSGSDRFSAAGNGPKQDERSWFSWFRFGDENLDGEQSGSLLPPPPVSFYHGGKSTTSGISDFERFGYASNPTVFGKILRGELSTRLFPGRETANTIAFRDIRPCAPLHGLVIPKAHVRSVLELTPSPSNGPDLLHEMRTVALGLVRDHHPEAYKTGDYVLCFHIPPFYSVDHLHLHVLAPASSMSWLYRYGKFNTGLASVYYNNNHNNGGGGGHEPGATTDTATTTTPLSLFFRVRWCIDLREVTNRLEEGSSPTPYRRDDSWGTILSDAAASLRAILRRSRSNE